MSLPLTASAKEVIHSHLGEANLIAVPDKRTVEDIDDPEAYRQLLEEEAANVKN